MKRLPLVSLAVFAAPLFAAEPPAADRDRERAVDTLFAEYAGSGSPGAAVGIYRGGEILYARGYGWADLEQRVPITTQTRFHVASISKQFTGFAIALLAREGKIDLDADIRKYLPYVPDFGHTITVRHLLHHCSGLRDLWELFAFGGHEPEGLLRQKMLLNLLTRQRELNFRPGEEYSYCNTGYTLLAEIVQVASGKSLRQFATERIFLPLGMTRTFFHDDLREVVPDRAHSYRRSGTTWQRQLVNYDIVGSTGVITTVGDMAKWAGNFARPTVGDPELLTAVTTAARLNGGTSVPYGFGLALMPLNGRRTISHAGIDAGFRTLFAWFPEHGLAIAVFANTPFDVSTKLAAVADIYLGSTAPKHERRAAPSLLAGAEGVYLATEPYFPSVEIELAGGNYWLKTTGSRQPLFLRDDSTLARENDGLNAYRVVRAGERISLLEWSGPLRTPVQLHRAVRVELPPEKLAELAGEYRSAELEISYRIEARAETLQAESLWSAQVVTFRPLAVDRFENDGWATLVFERDAQHRPVALRWSVPRTRSVLFQRVAAPPAALTASGR